ncbi:hypothetical protein CDAR_10961 [Caerostris darwini]|uniref:Uncharacterized protein n=1 Tax=Caerostris darwini TaxID=1538125 RepID=A0AAV4W5X2_9ARAC|nr:hypothetical protein CDAR_10961 [Caerostris darwini]
MQDTKPKTQKSGRSPTHTTIVPDRIFVSGETPPPVSPPSEIDSCKDLYSRVTWNTSYLLRRRHDNGSSASSG